MAGRISYILLIACLFCCDNTHEGKNKNSSDKQIIDTASQHSGVDTLLLSRKTKVSYPYDHTDYNGFGVEFFEHDLPIGQQDILLFDGVIYLLDRYHNNIKMIDLEGKLLKATSPLSNDQLWLKQVTNINDKILVISELDSLYIFTKDLFLLERKYLKAGNGRFYHESKKMAVIYYPQNGHEFVEINESGEIINTVKGINHKVDYQSEFNFIGEGDMEVDGRVYSDPQTKFADKIFDVEGKTVVFFNQDHDSLRLEFLFFDN